MVHDTLDLSSYVCEISVNDSYNERLNAEIKDNTVSLSALRVSAKHHRIPSVSKTLENLGQYFHHYVNSADLDSVVYL